MAGLFDSHYDQGSGGSLIERLLSQLQQPQQNSFSGLPSDQAQYGAAPQYGSPMFATAQMMPQQQPAPQPMPQQPQSQPMPQPVQAQPPPQMPPQMQQPMQAAPQQPMVNGIPEAFLQPTGGVGGFFRGLSDSARNGSGLLGSVLGGIAGANGQGPGDVHNRQLNAQYTALLQAGVPQPQALLATINPEFAKTIVPQALGPQTVTSLGNGYVADRKGNIKRAYEPEDKFKIVQTGQDGLGRQQFEVFNPADGSHVPIKSAGGASDAGGGLGNMELTGKEYLASLPKAQANLVQQMVEGTIAPPSSFALAKPYWTNMLAAAKNYDPTFDATAWSGRVAGAKDFSAGKSAEMVRSANQTLHHVGSLIDSMDALNNGSYPLWNRVGNAAAEATGSGAQGSFRSNAHAVATELSKVFKGSNLSDAEVHAWEQNLHENMSPEQQRTQVAKLGELLHGSLQALEEKRTNSMGPIAAEKAGPLIKEEGQRVLQRIDGWIREGSKGAASGAPGQTKTGVSWKVVQ